MSEKKKKKRRGREIELARAYKFRSVKGDGGKWSICIRILDKENPIK